MENKIGNHGKINFQTVKSAVGKIFVMIILTGMAVGLLFYDNPELFTIQSQSPLTSEDQYYHLNIPSQGQRVVCIVFDDGWKNQFDTAVPILDDYGFKATFGVITLYANKNYANYMNWTNIIALTEKGMDIESQTYSHLNLNEQGDSSIIYQLSQSKKDLLDHGINSSILIYPAGKGAGNSTVEALVRQYYLAARGVANKQLDLSLPFDRFNLPAYTMSKNTTMSKFKEIVNNANNSTIVILYYHKISHEHAGTAIAPRTFEREMRYLHDNNFMVMTLSQIFLAKK